MAINFLELVPNKNYGFQLTGGNLYVDLLTLNLVDGSCTSTYFNDPEIGQFQRTALELFAIVAPPERAPGALNLLNRILAVAPVDDAELTLSAVVVGDLATLRASINATPGSIVAHVPYSGDGALAWAGGNAGGGGGGGVATVTATFPVTSTGGAAPDIGLVLDGDAGLTFANPSGVQIKPGLTQGIAFNIAGEVVVTADPNYFDFSFGPGNLTPLDSGVVAGTYGDASNVAQVEVDAKGRVVSVTNVPIVGGGSVTDVTAASPLSSSGGTTPEISLNAGTLAGDVLTWNGVAWAASPVPAGSTVSLLNDVFVSKNGSDVTGDGSASKPFASVTAAMASITTAAPDNRFAIRLSAGDYAEAGAVFLKPDVFIIGDGWENTSVSTTGVALDVSWTAVEASFSGLYDVAINGPTTINFVPSASTTGRFNAVNTRFEDDLIVTAFSDSNIIGIVRCVTANGVGATFNGGDIFSFGTLYQGPITYGDSATAGRTYVTSMNDTFNGALTATNSGATPAGDFVVVMLGSSLGYEPGNPNARQNAIFNGEVILRATSNFVPDSAALILNAGATLEQWSFATGVGYEPAAPGDWLVAPTQVSGALDELASRVAAGGTVTDVTATGPLASSGGTNPDISIQAGTSPGDILEWNGTDWVITAPPAVAPTLQDAYDNSATPATIELANGKNLEVVPAAGAVAGFSLKPNSASDITATADLTVETYGAGNGLYLAANGADVQVTAGGAFNLQATDSASIESSNGPISIGDNGNDYALKLGTGGMREITIGNSGGGTDLALNLDTLTVNGSEGTSGQVLTSGGAGNPPTWTTPSSGGGTLQDAYDASATPATITLANGKNFEVAPAGGATAALRLRGSTAAVYGGSTAGTHSFVGLGAAQATFGQVDTLLQPIGYVAVTSGGTVDVHSQGGNLTLDAQSGNVVVQNTTSGSVDVNAIGDLTLDSSAGAINIGSDPVGGAVNVGNSASARTITVGSSSSTAVALNADAISLNAGSTVAASIPSASSFGLGANYYTALGGSGLPGSIQGYVGLVAGTATIGQRNVTGGALTGSLAFTGLNGAFTLQAKSAGGTVEAVSGNLTVKTTTSGTLTMESAGSAATAVSITAADAAGGVTVTTGTSGVSVATTGPLTVNGSPGTSGQVLTSNGSAAPTWTTPSLQGTITDLFVAGAAINAGEVCYLAADGNVYPALSDLPATSKVVGISTQTVGATATVAIATFNRSGTTLSGLTAGTEYFLSSTTPGALVEYGTLDDVSGVQIVSLGYARSASEIQINIQRRGTTP